MARILLALILAQGVAQAQIPTFTPLQTFTPFRSFTPIESFTPVLTFTPIRSFTPIPSSTIPGRPTPTITLTQTIRPTRTATATASPGIGTPTITTSRVPTLTHTPLVPTTETAGPQLCVGDCDGNHAVSITELTLGVLIITGERSLAFCPALDPNADGTLEINELIGAVALALAGCI
jgi:hypothetical protein